jgi:Cytochrome c7 and related cytochrome c
LLFTQQPFPFSHRQHAERKIPCAACHTAGTKAMSILSPTGCMGCHKTIATDKPAIKQLARTKKIEWEKVYELPYFVWFSHRRHAKTACQTCHGPVETRDVLEVEVQHSMRDCRACHVQTGARNECGTCHEAR